METENFSGSYLGLSEEERELIEEAFRGRIAWVATRKGFTQGDAKIRKLYSLMKKLRGTI